MYARLDGTPYRACTAPGCHCPLFSAAWNAHNEERYKLGLGRQELAVQGDLFR